MSLCRMNLEIGEESEDDEFGAGGEAGAGSESRSVVLLRSD